MGLRKVVFLQQYALPVSRDIQKSGPKIKVFYIYCYNNDDSLFFLQFYSLYSYRLRIN
jgi:hypothetical protein